MISDLAAFVLANARTRPADGHAWRSVAQAPSSVPMTALRALFVLAMLAAAPAVARAQTWQPRPSALPVDPHRYQADQHRLEMDRLRAQAEQREAFARQLEIETRLNRQRIEATRLPEPIQPPPLRALRSPEEERALRRSASARRAATTSDVGQIDAWLDRPRD